MRAYGPCPSAQIIAAKQVAIGYASPVGSSCGLARTPVSGALKHGGRSRRSELPVAYWVQGATAGPGVGSITWLEWHACAVLGAPGSLFGYRWFWAYKKSFARLKG